MQAAVVDIDTFQESFEYFPLNISIHINREYIHAMTDCGYAESHSEISSLIGFIIAEWIPRATAGQLLRSSLILPSHILFDWTVSSHLNSLPSLVLLFDNIANKEGILFLSRIFLTTSLSDSVRLRQLLVHLL